MGRGGRMNLAELIIALIIIFIAISMIMYSSISYVTQLRNFKTREEEVLQGFDFVNYAYDYVNSLIKNTSTPVVDFATVKDEGSLIVISDSEGKNSIRIIKWPSQ